MEDNILIKIESVDYSDEELPKLFNATITSYKENENALYDRSVTICSDSYYRTVEFRKDDMPKLLRYLADFGTSNIDADINGIVSILSDKREHS